MNYKDWAEANKLIYILSGSRLYGTYNDDSDYDYRGVCYMPKTVLLGLDNFEQYESKNPDTVIYGLIKFFRLAISGNPNILDVLFAKPDKWLEGSLNWQIVYRDRYLFLSQLVRKTFVGYAIAQMKRMKTHREWLLNQPQEPKLSNYGCWLYNDVNGGQKIGYNYEQDFNDYKNVKSQWDNYNEWLKLRNPKRLITEQKIGYDTKNAGHLMRLLYSGKSILQNCDYDPTLFGHDLERVKEVMAGYFSYDNLLNLAELYIDEIDKMPTDLKKVPNYDAVQELLIQINYSVLKRGMTY